MIKIIVLSENPIIKIFNITTFENINIDSGEDKLNSLLVLKDNRFLIGGRNGNIKIFNFNNNKIKIIKKNIFNIYKNNI